MGHIAVMIVIRRQISLECELRKMCSRLMNVAQYWQAEVEANSSGTGPGHTVSYRHGSVQALAPEAGRVTPAACQWADWTPSSMSDSLNTPRVPVGSHGDSSATQRARGPGRYSSCHSAVCS